jgi:hypothetical protein
LQVYENENQVFEKFFEYPLEVNITVRLVQGLRPGFPNKAEVAIDGQAVWASQKEVALPTRAHIGMPRGHRNPVKCTCDLVSAEEQEGRPEDVNVLPPPGYYIRTYLLNAAEGDQGSRGF